MMNEKMIEKQLEWLGCTEEEYIEEENIYDDAEMLPFDIGD